MYLNKGPLFLQAKIEKLKQQKFNIEKKHLNNRICRDVIKLPLFCTPGSEANILDRLVISWRVAGGAGVEDSEVL